MAQYDPTEYRRPFAQSGIEPNSRRKRATSSFPKRVTSYKRTKEDSVAIFAVMGKTGSGKSSFISKVAVQNYGDAIGHTLVSKTQDVHEVDCQVNNHRILLIDTPGFDDTNVDTGTILKRIANWLEDYYDKNKLLTGIIYCYDITGSRCSGSAARNMVLFERLIGQDTMKNVILLSTKWDIADQGTAEDRDRELKSTPGFWQMMLSDGAQAMRHDGTQSSAERVILGLLGRQPSPVLLQKELAKGMRISETAAGAFVDHEIIKLQNEHRQEIESLKQLMQTAEQRNKFELARTLQEQYEKIMKELSHMQTQREELFEERFRATESKIKELDQRALVEQAFQTTETSWKADVPDNDLESTSPMLVNDRDDIIAHSMAAQSDAGLVYHPTAGDAVFLNAMDVATEATSNISQEPKVFHFYCTYCNEHPNGVLKSSELEQHFFRKHVSPKKGYTCVDFSLDKKFLAWCKHCRNGKLYGASFNAVAHLRRTHFHSRPMEHKVNEGCKVDEHGRDISSGDRFGVGYLSKHWIKEVQVHGEPYSQTSSPELLDSREEDDIPSTIVEEQPYPDVGRDKSFGAIDSAPVDAAEVEESPSPPERSLIISNQDTSGVLMPFSISSEMAPVTREEHQTYLFTDEYHVKTTSSNINNNNSSIDINSPIDIKSFSSSDFWSHVNMYRCPYSGCNYVTKEGIGSRMEQDEHIRNAHVPLKSQKALKET